MRSFLTKTASMEGAAEGALERQSSGACDAGPVPQLTDKALKQAVMEYSRGLAIRSHYKVARNPGPTDQSKIQDHSHPG